MITRSRFTIIFLVAVIAVVIVNLIYAVNVFADEPIDPYADEVAMVNGSGMLNPFELIGEPDGDYAILTGAGGDFLIMDMGEGEEGTGDLIIHHGPITLVSVSLSIDFLDANYNIVDNDMLIIDISLQPGTVTADYHPSPLPAYTPYRYVRFNSPMLSVELDAIQAVTHRPDSDGDGLPDDWEIEHGTDPLDPTGDNGADGDPDNDGLPNIEEHEHGTDPHNPDTDGDGMPDGWEVDYGLDPTDPTGDNGADGDPDGDGLPNKEEYDYVTDPHNPDTDGDGMPDGWEVNSSLEPTDPTGDNGASGDPDSDGLPNIGEYQASTDPHNPDTDGDGLPDGWEVNHSLDPLDSTGNNGANGEPDNDLLTNITEYRIGTDPQDWDTDDDGLDDGWEVDKWFDPLDSTGDNGADGNPDNDGLTNIEEYYLGTDPLSWDSDGDGMPDGWEADYSLDPLSSIGDNGANGDPDQDNLINIEEFEKGTNPQDKDTDNGGMEDGFEVEKSLDPLNSMDDIVYADDSEGLTKSLHHHIVNVDRPLIYKIMIKTP